MRRFQCNKCMESNTLYDWNTNERAYRNLTLHEVRDYEEFDDLKKMIFFTCPSCKQKSLAVEITEVN